MNRASLLLLALLAAALCMAPLPAQAIDCAALSRQSTTTCNSCTAHPECGWCSLKQARPGDLDSLTRSMCMNGDAFGPHGSSACANGVWHHEDQRLGARCGDRCMWGCDLTCSGNERCTTTSRTHSGSATQFGCSCRAEDASKLWGMAVAGFVMVVIVMVVGSLALVCLIVWCRRRRIVVSQPVMLATPSAYVQLPPPQQQQQQQQGQYAPPPGAFYAQQPAYGVPVQQQGQYPQYPQYPQHPPQQQQQAQH